MRQFLWKGTRSGQSHYLTMVSWDVICRPIKRGGLGILHVQSMNTALFTKWVTRMDPQEDLATLILKYKFFSKKKLLKDKYGRGLDWVS